MDDTTITTVEMHTGGEPLRVVTFGFPSIKGETILDKLVYVEENLDHLRKILMHEPRGHHDMFGAIQVEPDNELADVAFLFIHNEGYSPMCGHAVISLGRYLVDKKIVEYKEPEAEINIQCPCGVVKTYVHCNNGKTDYVRFLSVWAFAVCLDYHFTTPSYGKLKADIAYGGAFYAFVSLSKVGLTVDTPVKDIAKAATEIKSTLIEQVECIHPSEKKLSFLYGIIFIDDHNSAKSKLFNITIYANAAVNRSPCGSGVTARMAVLFAKNMISLDEVVEVENPITKSSFRASIAETKKGEGLDNTSVMVEVKGNGYYTGTASFTAENDDPLKSGFLIS